MRIQTFRSEFAIERLDEGIVGGLARPGEVQRDPTLISPQVEIARDETLSPEDASSWYLIPVWPARGKTHNKAQL
jgi:hypothetical protein